MNQRFLAVGECMIELAEAEDGQYQRGFAGDTFNTAWYARKTLGDEWMVGYLSALGDDQSSDAMREFMMTADIDTSYIRTIPGKSPGLYMIHLDNGERTFSYWRDTAAARQLAADKPFLDNSFAEADVIYFSGITLAILPPDQRDQLTRALERAHHDGRQIIFDTNLRPRLWPNIAAMRNAIMNAAAISTLILPSFEDEADHFGDQSPADTAKRYMDVGAKHVVVKNGPGSVLVLHDGERHSVPPEQTVTAVDTTAAGDSFNAAYIAEFLRSGDVKAAVRAGHDLASHVISHRGALVS